MKKSTERHRVHHIKIGDCTEVEFVPHAIHRLEQRGIKESDVISALKHSKKKKISADFPYKGITSKKSPKLTLCVIFEITGDRLTVITAYWK